MPRLLTLPLALVFFLGPAALRAETPDERNIVILTLPQSRDLWILPAGRPSLFIRHLATESWGVLNGQEVGAPEQLMGCGWDWGWDQDSPVRTCKSTVGPRGKLNYVLTMMPHPDFVDVRIEVTNSDQHTYRDVWAWMCFDFRRCPLMYDGKQERTYVQIDGTVRKVCDTDTRASENGVMPAYFLMGSKPEDRWLPKPTLGYGWGISSNLVDVPIVAMESTDRKWVVGVWYEPCRNVLANAKGTGHGCFHVDPFFGTLAPGQSATAVGRIYIQKGTLDAIWQRMLNDWKVVNREKKG